MSPEGSEMRNTLARSLLSATFAIALSFGASEAMAIDAGARNVPAPGLAPVTVRHDLGGNVVTYARTVSQIRIDRRPVRISGRCDSACTMYLALPPSQVCIEPGASFGFHKAFGSTRDMNAWGTRYLHKSYPAWVQSWLAQRGGLARNLKRMPYAHAARHLPRCDGRVASAR